MIVAVANQKGGVGKTTVTANLGAALHRLTQKPVLLIDLDPQASLTAAMGVNPASLKPSMYDVMVSRIPMKSVLREPWPGVRLAPSTIDLAGAEVELVGEIGREMVLGEKLADLLERDNFDYVLIDCPPSLGLLTVNALTAAQGVIVPVECGYLAFRGMQLLLDTIRKIQRRSNPVLRVLGVLPTLYDSRTVHAQEVLARLQKDHPGPLCDLPVKRRVALALAAMAGQSIFDYDPKSDSTETFSKIAEEVVKLCQSAGV